jgi:hypothetical protein
LLCYPLPKVIVKQKIIGIQDNLQPYDNYGDIIGVFCVDKFDDFNWMIAPNLLEFDAWDCGSQLRESNFSLKKLSVRLFRK